MNIKANSGHFFGYAEPDQAINPRDPTNILAAAQFELSAQTRIPGALSSVTGGRTWIEYGLLPLPAGFVQGADTTVAFSPAGVGFISALVVGSAGSGHASGVQQGAIVIWRTSDGGRTFSQPLIVYRANSFQDHPWLAVDSNGTLYIAWSSDGGLVLSKSTDGGNTWVPPQQLVAGSNALDPVVLAGPPGRLHILYEAVGATTIGLVSMNSSDGGRTFQAAPIGEAVEAHLPGSAGPKGDVQVPLFGAASDASGARVFAAITSFPAGAGHPTVMMWSSTTGGDTWSLPFPAFGGRASNLALMQPRLTVASDAQVSVLAIAADRAGVYRLLLSTDPNLTRPGSVRQISSACFASDQWLGDYQALAFAPGALHILWNDGRSGRLNLEAASI